MNSRYEYSAKCNSTACVDAQFMNTGKYIYMHIRIKVRRDRQMEIDKLSEYVTLLMHGKDCRTIVPFGFAGLLLLRNDKGREQMYVATARYAVP